MRISPNDRSSERGGAAVKFLFVFLILLLAANAGYNYIPVAYNGASFRQEMDTAVVKGLAASGQMKPMDVVQGSVQRAAIDYQIPNDAFIEIKPVQGIIQVHVSYSQPVNMLPFGMYRYNYTFDHTARPTGYLLKESK